MVKRYLDPGFLLIATGAAVIILLAFSDSIGMGQPGFGLQQVGGMVIGAFVAVVGLLKSFFPNKKKLAQVIAAIYLIGILYAGLRRCGCPQGEILLDATNFGWNDVAINTIGFIPMGYLLMLSFGNQGKDERGNLFARVIIVSGFGGLISLFLEVFQHYLILGRQSSLFDWVSNTLGTLIGIAVYLFLNSKPGV